MPSIWSLPDVQDQVFRFNGLSKSDLALAMLTCRTWAAIIRPYIYEHVVLDRNHKSNPALKTALFANIRYLRVLETTKAYGLDWISESKTTDLSRLQELDYTHTFAKRQTDSLEIVLSKANDWRRIRFAGPRRLWEFARMFKGIPNWIGNTLQELDLYRVHFNGPELGIVLDQHCHSLKVLKLSKCKFSKDAFDHVKKLNHLRTLVWKDVHFIPPQPTTHCPEIRKLIEATSGLQDLTLKISCRETMSYLAIAMSTGCLSMSLQSLQWRMCCVDRPSSEPAVARILQSLPFGLHTLYFEGFPLALRANEILLSRIQTFGNTLSSLSFSWSAWISKQLLIIVLTTCPLLKVFKADSCSLTSKLIDPEVGNLDILLKRSWLCPQLEQLEMQYVPGFRGQIPDEKSYLEADTGLVRECEWLISEISKLKKLKKLKLSVEAWLYRAWSSSGDEQKFVRQKAKQERLNTCLGWLDECTLIDSVKVDLLFRGSELEVRCKKYR